MPPLKHNKDLPGSKSGTTAWYCGPTLIPPPAEGGRGRSVTRVGPSGPYNSPRPQKNAPRTRSSPCSSSLDDPELPSSQEFTLLLPLGAADKLLLPPLLLLFAPAAF